MNQPFVPVGFLYTKHLPLGILTLYPPSQYSIGPQQSMNFLEITRQTLATFKAHKMRIFLTMFGIVWGIASVILLVGLGRGFSVDQKKRMETLGKDLVILWGGRTSSQVGGRAAGREIQLNVDDADLIRDECYLVKNACQGL